MPPLKLNEHFLDEIKNDEKTLQNLRNILGIGIHHILAKNLLNGNQVKIIK